MSIGLVSIVVPVYNEILNIVPMYNRIKAVFDKNEYDFELIYVDNCSFDGTQEEIRKLAEKDKSVHGILMSRNFGSSQPSTIAGVHFAKGHAVVLIDGDIQDPPELITEFIKKWEEGFEVVYGIRKKRKGSLLRRICYKLFYRVFKWLSYVEMPLDAGDFGLVDRKVVNEIKRFNENEIFFRGIRAWVGFRQTGIQYVREDRNSGKTSIPFLANFKWAKMGIFNFSYKPLEFISKAAGIITVIAMIAIVFYIVLHFVTPSMPIGFSTTVIIVLFLSSIQLLALSIMGEYIARIFNEVKGRPRYVVREIINSNTSQDSYLSEAKIINEKRDTDEK